MRRFFRVTIQASVILMLCFLPVLSQSYDLRFETVSMDGVTLVVNAQIKASSTFKMGTSTIIFNYNTSDMTYASMSPSNFSGGNYGTMTKSGDVSLNIFLNTTPGTAVSTSWMDIAQITFNITDPSGSSGLTWNSGGTTVWEETESSEMSQGTFNDLDTTLPVELSSFTAENLNGLIEIKWTTESERENIGFNLYRSDAKDGRYVKINGEMIKGAGNSTTTLLYKFVDNRLENHQTYYYKLEDIDVEGRFAYHGPIEVTVQEVKPPDDYYIQQNFPNPFNPSTKIYYGLPEAARVKLLIYNLRGELVRTLVNEEQQPGHLIATWDGLSDSGHRVPSGVYIYRLEANNFRQVKKMLFAK